MSLVASLCHPTGIDWTRHRLPRRGPPGSLSCCFRATRYGVSNSASPKPHLLFEEPPLPENLPVFCQRSGLGFHGHLGREAAERDAESREAPPRPLSGAVRSDTRLSVVWARAGQHSHAADTIYTPAPADRPTHSHRRPGACGEERAKRGTEGSERIASDGVGVGESVAHRRPVCPACAGHSREDDG